jgi:hypothetical protein
MITVIQISLLILSVVPFAAFSVLLPALLLMLRSDYSLALPDCPLSKSIHILSTLLPNLSEYVTTHISLFCDFFFS